MTAKCLSCFLGDNCGFPSSRLLLVSLHVITKRTCRNLKLTGDSCERCMITRLNTWTPLWLRPSWFKKFSLSRLNGCKRLTMLKSNEAVYFSKYIICCRSRFWKVSLYIWRHFYCSENGSLLVLISGIRADDSHTEATNFSEPVWCQYFSGRIFLLWRFHSLFYCNLVKYGAVILQWLYPL